MNKDKITQRQVENGLDSLITRIIISLDPEIRCEELERFRVGLIVLGRAGYDVFTYNGIYNELKNNFNGYDLIKPSEEHWCPE